MSARVPAWQVYYFASIKVIIPLTKHAQGGKLLGGTIPVHEAYMQRLNDYKFYELGLRLKPIEDLERASKYKDVFFVLYQARAAVEETLEEFPLAICKGPADQLINSITDFVPRNWSEVTSADMEAEPGYKSYFILKAKEAFENVLSAALTALDTYLLTEQGIYNTASLVDRADMAFSEAVRETITEEAKKDFRQGGRCLAFELPTASGFHTMRSTEAVLRQYHRLVTGLAADKRSPEMAQCINELKSKGEDPKIINILDSIRDLHRNPQMHPEAFLSMDEAMRLFDISKSAIGAMADRIASLLPAKPSVFQSLLASSLLGVGSATEEGT